MERMTVDETNLRGILEQCGGDYCKKIDGDCSRCGFLDMALEKLRDYEKKEQNGLLKHFPCRVGTHIYIVNRRWHVVEAGHICGISECDNVDCLCYRVYVDPDTYTDILISDFGKEWFLTEPEAEQALAKMKGV